MQVDPGFLWAGFPSNIQSYESGLTSLLSYAGGLKDFNALSQRMIAIFLSQLLEKGEQYIESQVRSGQVQRSVGRGTSSLTRSALLLVCPPIKKEEFNKLCTAGATLRKLPSGSCILSATCPISFFRKARDPLAMDQLGAEISKLLPQDVRIETLAEYEKSLMSTLEHQLPWHTDLPWMRSDRLTALAVAAETHPKPGKSFDTKASTENSHPYIPPLTTIDFLCHPSNGDLHQMPWHISDGDLFRRPWSTSDGDLLQTPWHTSDGALCQTP